MSDRPLFTEEDLEAACPDKCDEKLVEKALHQLRAKESVHMQCWSRVSL
jgi:hypothetical protein